MRDPVRVIAGCVRDHADSDPGWDTSHATARAILAALRNEYGDREILEPSPDSAFDLCDVTIIPVPIGQEQTDA